MDNSNIAELCLIGANSTIIEKISICNNVCIGAVQQLLNLLKSFSTYVGSPAKEIEKKNDLYIYWWFKNLNAIQAIKLLAKNKINSIELSGGVYTNNLETQLKNLSGQFELIIHNYFPVPKNPFVLNLASLDENIFQESLNHIKKSIKLASLIKVLIIVFMRDFLLTLM